MRKIGYFILGAVFQPILPTLLAFVLFGSAAVGSLIWYFDFNVSNEEKIKNYPAIERCEFIDILNKENKIYKVKCDS